MIKWFRSSLARKAVLFIIILEIFVTIVIFQAMSYAARKGFITADRIRNNNVFDELINALDMDQVENMCELGKEFYLSHRDLYKEYRENPALINEEYSSMAGEPRFSDFKLALQKKSWGLGVDTVRVVLVDYKKDVLFTFMTTMVPYPDLSEDMWLYRKPGIEPSGISPDEDVFCDSDILEDNKSSIGDVTSTAYFVSKDDEHNIRLYLFADTDDVLSGLIGEYVVRNTVVGMIIITILLGIIIFLLINREVIQPMNSLSLATRSLIPNLGDEGNREYVYQKIRIHTGDEIEHLYHSVQTMEEGLYNYMDRLKEATSEKERISTELYIAESIQKNMLPSAAPDFTNQPCFDLAASMNPAKEVGGDFYDFFMLSEDKLAFLIADVSGKGVPAALVMAIGKSMLKNYTKETGNIGDAFRIVNNLLLDVNNDHMFITAFGAVLDLRTGDMEYVNAGHEDPFIMRAEGEFVLQKERHAIVLGAMEDMRYKSRHMVLCPGDRIYIYTDGVPEAQDHDFNMFGLAGACEALNKVRNEPAERVIEAVKESVDVFVKNEPQFDDMTMLCVDFKAYYQD